VALTTLMTAQSPVILQRERRYASSSYGSGASGGGMSLAVSVRKCVRAAVTDGYRGGCLHLAEPDMRLVKGWSVDDP
jgi:hypothetical protein